MQVRDCWILILEQIGVLERVWLVRNFLESFGTNLLPIVGGLQLHEHAVLLEFVYGGAHGRVTLEYLVQEVTSDHVDSFFANEQLPRQNLLLNFHWVILFLER